MLEVQSLNVGYGARLVLRDISFKVGKGEIVALIGPNGTGKTTLMRTVSGVLKPRSGQLRVFGQDLTRISAAQRAKYISVVPQARDLPEDFTVLQTILLGRTPYLGWLGQMSLQDRERVSWALKRVHLQELAQRPMGELSGGEQQRVLLARALAQDTPILLLDEPTSHLDLHHQSILLNLVQELAREKKLAVLMVLHDLNLAALYADRVALMVEGCLRTIGSPEEVLTSKNLAGAYKVPVHVIPHPDYGTPLVLPDGRGMPIAEI